MATEYHERMLGLLNQRERLSYASKNSSTLHALDLEAIAVARYERELWQLRWADRTQEEAVSELNARLDAARV